VTTYETGPKKRSKWSRCRLRASHSHCIASLPKIVNASILRSARQ